MSRRVCWSGRLLLAGLATALLSGVVSPALTYAQQDPRLQEARQIGSIVWYTTSFPTEMGEAIEKRFSEHTGIRLSTYRAGGGQVAARLRTERQTGARNVDVVDLGDMEVVNGLVREGLFRPFPTKVSDSLDPSCKDPQNNFFGYYNWVLVLEYNTGSLRSDAVPRSFDDLIDERFKGKVVIPDPARSTGGLGFIKAMVAAKGWEWIERFVRNDPLVMAIGSGIQPALIRGERPIAVNNSQFLSNSMQEKAPVGLAANEFLFASPNVIGILKDAPNPKGAELFVEFLLSKEMQEIVRVHGVYSCRSDLAPPFGLPALKDAKLRFKQAPSIGMDTREISERFQKLLRAAK